MKTLGCVMSMVLVSVASVGQAQEAAPALLARGADATHWPSLPGRTKNRYTPGRVVSPRLLKVGNSTHPTLGARFLPGDVIELHVRDMGARDSGATVELVAGPPAQPVTLRVVNWTDKVVRVQLPDRKALGIDAKEAAAMEQKLRKGAGEVGFRAQVGFKKDGHWLGGSRRIYVVVMGDDVDGDGHMAAPWGDDCDDFDPRRSPGHREQPDDWGLDEDCNPNTTAPKPEVVAASSPDQKLAEELAQELAQDQGQTVEAPEQQLAAELDLDGEL